MKPEDQRLTREQVGSIVKMLGLTTRPRVQLQRVSCSTSANLPNASW